MKPIEQAHVPRLYTLYRLHTPRKTRRNLAAGNSTMDIIIPKNPPQRNQIQSHLRPNSQSHTLIPSHPFTPRPPLNVLAQNLLNPYHSQPQSQPRPRLYDPDQPPIKLYPLHFNLNLHARLFPPDHTSVVESFRLGTVRNWRRCFEVETDGVGWGSLAGGESQGW
jgi:hypothetical protein